MNVLPADIGAKLCDDVLSIRIGSDSRYPRGSGHTALGPITRLWLGAAAGRYSVEIIEESIHRAAKPTWISGIIGIQTILYFAESWYVLDSHFGLIGALLAGCLSVGIPRAIALRHCELLAEGPVTASEIDAILRTSHSGIERSYLMLVRDAIRSAVTDGPDQSLRQAICMLGNAVDKLATPLSGESGSNDVPDELRRTADEILRLADFEHDSVVSASLVRRADALCRRAEAITRRSALARRFTALREEMEAEIEALRAGLVALDRGLSDIADLTHLAGVVQRVAAEAAATTEAVEEATDIFVTTTPQTTRPASIAVPVASFEGETGLRLHT